MVESALLYRERLVQELQRMVDKPIYGAVVILLCIFVWWYKSQEG